MAAKLIVLPEANRDVDEAADWYEQDRPGRGKKFSIHVRACIRGILRVPRAFTPVVGPFRKRKVASFPYVVVYRYDAAAKTVTVVAVFHTSRDPDDLLRRLT